MGTPDAHLAYEIGPFRLDPEARLLTRDGAPTVLGPRAVVVLTALVEHPNEVVAKGRILDVAWPNRVVEEGNLAVQIAAIRRVLTQAGGERWIETVAGRGYRFVGPVTKVSDAGGRAQRSTLPEPFTSFIGRERELAEIKRLLLDRRLLTLVGAGGVGKTRLARQLAAEVGNTYRDGVWLAELAPLVGPALVPQTVAAVLGLKEQPGKSLTQTLSEHLASRHLLLLLDNAEHLLAACAQLISALLPHCPQVLLLVTSRERLGIVGELTYRVPSLSIPDSELRATPEALEQYESAQLLTERARLQLPQFAVTRQNAPALASICRRLGGIPLALELAAARLRSMSVEEVNRRLDQQFRLLTGGSPTALPRQQTLRSLIDWSYDLLNDGEKAVLGRVSVFSGGWTLEAAEQVCVGEGIEEDAVLDLLTSLFDKSLVVADERKGVTRYRLLETVRQYARDRLLQTGKDAPWRDRHLAYFVALAEEADPQLKGADQSFWFDRLGTEHDNLRSALAWASAAGGDTAGGLRLAGALSWYWYIRGYFGEGRGWLAPLLDGASETQVMASRAKALNGAGNLALRAGDLADARALHAESLAIRREIGDRRGNAESLNNLGNVAHEQGDYAAAQALHEESLTIRRELGHRSGIADSLNNLGVAAYEQGNYRVARALHEESLTIRRELGHRWGIADSLNNLGAVAYEQGNYSVARALHEESLTIRRELGHQGGIVWSLERLAYVAFALAAPARAARIWGGAERLREEISAPLLPAERLRHDRQVVAARAVIGDDAAFARAWQEGRAMTLEEVINYALKKEP